MSSESSIIYIISNLNEIISKLIELINKPLPWLCESVLESLDDIKISLEICLKDIRENRLGEAISLKTVEKDIASINSKLDFLKEECEEERELDESIAKKIKSELRLTKNHIDILIRNLRKIPSRPSTLPPSPPSLVISSMKYPITVKSIILGRREEDNHLIILDKGGRLLYDVGIIDQYITRYKPSEHKMGNTSIYFSEGNWYITDLRSTNGTKVNNIEIIRPVKLNDGDKITIGNTTILFKLYA